ncbi:MAG: phage portal protein [Lachnospiraceae bacterium]|nr:phage portal protein [Lachnospiraceae bacterium]
MYRFTKEQVLDPAFLTRLIGRFKNEQIPRFAKDERYYRVKTQILERTMTDGKPNNKLAHGFCRYITNMATSYFAGKPIRYLFDPKDEDMEQEAEAYKDAVTAVFKDNYIDSLNFEVSKEASKKGIGFYLIFSNEFSKLRIKKLDAETVIPVYSPSLDEFLETAVRIWSEYDIEGTLLCEYADVYDDTHIHHFRRMSGEFFYAEYRVPEPHYLGDIPVIIVWNNEEQLGDYEPVITLNDAYDNAQSDTANDMDYFTDAYLCITGASSMVEDALAGDGSGEDEDDGSTAVRNLRKNRILFLDENGQAQWLTKNVNDAVNENYKDRLYKDIFFLSQVPALTDESFSGNLSGIAIKYKMTGLEELAIMKENRMRSAQTKMLRIITDFLNTKMNKHWDPDMIEQKYDRNFVENVSDVITDVRNLDGIISRETQLDMLPLSVVSDTSSELDRQRQESLDAEGLPKVDLDSIDRM